MPTETTAGHLRSVSRLSTITAFMLDTDVRHDISYLDSRSFAGRRMPKIPPDRSFTRLFRTYLHSVLFWRWIVKAVVGYFLITLQKSVTNWAR